MLKVIGFSACSDMVATAIVFEISRLCQMYTFPDQMMNCQFVLIMARNHKYLPSSPSIYYMSLSLINVKCRMDGFYRKP